MIKSTIKFMQLQNSQIKQVKSEVYDLIRVNVSSKITNDKDDKVWYRVRNRVRQEVWLRVGDQISSVINSRDVYTHHINYYKNP
jgi:hypothetical protein